MSILEKAKEHFAAHEISSVAVPEWDATIYWKPWTVAERQRVYGAVKASGRDAELSARVLIAKALDRDGKPMFGLDDLRALTTSVDATVVERIALAIIGVAPTVEEAEKN